MNRVLVWAIVGATAAASPAPAGDPHVVPVAGFRKVVPVTPGCQTCPPAPLVIPPTPDPKDPKDPNPNPNPNPDPNPNPNTDPNPTNPQQREGGGQSAASFNASMFGDFPGISYTRLVQGFRPVTTTTQVPVVTGFTERVTLDAAGNKVVTRVPTVTFQQVTTTTNQLVTERVNGVLAGRYAGIRMAENDSPLPRDRVYAGYNYFDDLNKALNPGLPPISQQQQTLGFEKTFDDRRGSIGMRIPFIQVYGLIGQDENNIGDLSIVGKYAFYLDRETNDCFSGGMILTAPTGTSDAQLINGQLSPHSTLFQPWVGYVSHFNEDFYSQGFSSCVIPSDGRDPTALFNSVGFGYWAYRARDAFLTGIVPITEFHVTTPLSNRNPANPIFLQDQLNVTVGSYFVFGKATLGTGVCVPTVGPRPWNIEAIVNLNYVW